MSFKVTKGGASHENFLTFEDLDVYEAARNFRKAMYAVNRRLPDFEKYDLGSQIRRAATTSTGSSRCNLRNFSNSCNRRWSL
jgi:hypothetical protein